MTLHLISDRKKAEKPPVDPELLRICRGLLAGVESGEVRALIGLVEYHDEDQDIDYLYGGDYDPWRMRGLLGDLAIEITTPEDEDDE